MEFSSPSFLNGSLFPGDAETLFSSLGRIVLCFLLKTLFEISEPEYFPLFFFFSLQRTLFSET